MNKIIKLILVVAIAVLSAAAGFSSDYNFKFDKAKIMYERATRAYERPGHDSRYDSYYRIPKREYERARSNCTRVTSSYCKGYCNKAIKGFKQYLAVMRYRYTYVDISQTMTFTVKYKTRAKEILQGKRRGGQIVKAKILYTSGLGFLSMGRRKYKNREYKEAIIKYDKAAGLFNGFVIQNLR